MTWSEALAEYLKRNQIPGHVAAAALGVAPSTVHYWTKGSEPRGDAGRDMKKRVERWTGGQVKAAPWVASTADDSGARTATEPAKSA